MVVRYWLTVALQVRRELHGWEQRARSIPDPALRAHALRKLRDEHLNAEAAATFATLGSYARQTSAVRLMVAFEVMYDYLDGVSEQPADDPLANGLHLHRALGAAVGTNHITVNFYALNAQRDDGGYLQALVTTCRSAFARLPSAAAIRPVVSAAVVRCGEAQSRTHTVPYSGSPQLEEWARSFAGQWEWWEWAAGSTASLSIHALFAAATWRGTTEFEAMRIDSAYNPAIGALATLLDSLVDRAQDEPDVDHSYIAYYESPAELADGLMRIVQSACEGARGLGHAQRHLAIVTGIACFYLSSRDARAPATASVAKSIIGAIGPVAAPTLLMLRWRRRLSES